MWYNTKVSIWMRSAFGEACKHTGAFTSAVAETFSPHFHFLFTFTLLSLSAFKNWNWRSTLLEQILFKWFHQQHNPDFHVLFLAERGKNWWQSNDLVSPIAICNKSNGSYVIKDFGTLSLIFSTSKYFRQKFQPCPSFFSHPNIPDKWKRLPLSLDQMKKKEKVKVKS